MNNLLKKMSKAWQNYWMDDEYDLDKKHLSQHDKRSLLCGGFMIGFVTFLLFSTGIIIGNAWSNYKSQKEVNQIKRRSRPEFSGRLSLFTYCLQSSSRSKRSICVRLPAYS